MIEFSLLSVFLVGLLGGVHCLGMCGSIVGIFTTQAPPGRTRWPFHLAYSGGRIASYVFAGALAGALGQAGLLMRDAVPIQHLLFALSSVMLLLLGMYLAGWGSAVRRLEGAGGVLWKRLQPLTSRLLPVSTLPRALGLGVLWGWLPCGLVYSILVTALASASPQSGAAIMLAFGLGTLPNLLVIGLFWESLRRKTQLPLVRTLAGSLVMAFGGYGLIKVGYTFYIHGWAGACHVAA